MRYACNQNDYGGLCMIGPTSRQYLNFSGKISDKENTDRRL